MRSRFRVLLVLAAATAAAGCGGKDESKPNPDFKVPDIPAGKRDMPAQGGKKP